MEHFADATWALVLQLSAALGVIAAILSSIYFIITRTTWFANAIEKREVQKRLETCPQKAVMAAYKANQDKKMKDLIDTIEHAVDTNLSLQGSHIVLFCMFAKFKCYLSRYERMWLQNIYDDYTNKGGNHGVSDIFKETMLLPEEAPHNRRCTDK